MKMEHDKEHFRDSLLYCFDSKTVAEAQKFNLLHQLKHVSTVSMIQKG